MTFIIDTTKSRRKQLPSFNEHDAKKIKNKGWSFSYVYNFTEIRDVYLALNKTSFISLPSFFRYCIEINLPFVRTKWNKRRLLEHLNALKNFDLLDGNYLPRKQVFTLSSIGDPLSDDDISTFKYIYFNYFRFKELFAWLISPTIADREQFIINLTENEIINNSKPIFAYSNISRFTDSFFYEISEKPDLFFIDARINEDLMRFWDVFIKWGTVLGVLEKFSLRNLDIKTVDQKNIACVYVVNNNDCKIDFLKFINENYSERYIYLPFLVLDLAINYRCTIEYIKKLIIDQYLKHKEYLSFERTSEIFVKKLEIRENDKIFFPKHNDSYVSHLIIRK